MVPQSKALFLLCDELHLAPSIHLGTLGIVWSKGTKSNLGGITGFHQLLHACMAMVNMVMPPRSPGRPVVGFDHLIQNLR